MRSGSLVLRRWVSDMSSTDRSCASLEIFGWAWAAAHVFRERGNIFIAGAKIWVILIDLFLDLGLLTKLSSGVVNSSNKQVSLDEAVEEGASQSVNTLDHVIAHSISSGSKCHGDNESTNGNDLRYKLVRSNLNGVATIFKRPFSTLAGVGNWLSTVHRYLFY